jgi:hypothetical protein
VGSLVQERSLVEERLHNPRKIAMLEVAEAAVDDSEGVVRSSPGTGAGLEEEGLHVAACGFASDAEPRDAATKYD